MQITRHYFISGKVQGVWYRASTQKEAQRLKLTGWVANLADGRVEAVATGTAEQLAQFESWLKVGPPKAQVEQVMVEQMDNQQFAAFLIKR